MSQNGNKCLTKEIKVIEAESFCSSYSLCLASSFSRMSFSCIHWQSYQLSWLGFTSYSSSTVFLSDSILIYFRALTTCIRRDYLGIYKQ